VPRELLVLLALVAAPYVGTTAFVAWNTFACWVVAGRVPMDAQQATAFADRSAGPFTRVWAVLREGWFQLLVWWGDLIHALGVRRTPRPAATGTPVVLLPGYTEGKGTMGYLGRWLHAEGFRVYVEAFPSTFQPILAETGADEVALVGHSMGGVISRAYVHTYPDHRVRTVVCFGSPQRGSILAVLGPGASPKDMCIGSAHNRRFPIETTGPVPIHSMVGTQDHIISPAWSFVTREGENHVLREPAGHVGPMFLQEGREQLRRWLEAEEVRRAV
jgi:hypothetical protein